MKRLLCIALLWVAPCIALAQDAPNGVFLVAQPSLTEPTFRRTVILITQLPRMGLIGVIVNRPTETSLRDVFPKHDNIAALPQTLHFGGPVARQGVMFLVRATSPPPRSIAVLQDVYLLSDADWLDAALADANAPSAVRVFAGYAGWAPGQLQSELKREGWTILPADSATIFDKDVDSVWPELAKRAVLRPTVLNISQ